MAVLSIGIIMITYGGGEVSTPRGITTHIGAGTGAGAGAIRITAGAGITARGIIGRGIIARIIITGITDGAETADVILPAMCTAAA